ncbi:MAG: hypothetical protein AAGK14_13675 [Verrucomicrobiota bacterium]
MSAKIIVADAEGKHWGPYEQEHIREYLEAGNFTPLHWAMREGDADWSPLHELVEPVVKEPSPPPSPQPQKVQPLIERSVQPAAVSPVSSPTPVATPSPAAQPTASPSPIVQPVATPTPAAQPMATPSPTPVGTPVKSPPPREFTPPVAEHVPATTKAGGTKDPMALPVVILGALLAIGGLYLLYADLDFLWYAAGMTIAAVLASLYGMLRGQLVPGLALVAVTLIGAGVVGFLALSAQEERVEMLKMERNLELRQSEEESAQRFLDQTKVELAQGTERLQNALAALQADATDANWEELNAAVGAQIQTLQVSGESAGSGQMQLLEGMQIDIMSRDAEAVADKARQLPAAP